MLTSTASFSAGGGIASPQLGDVCKTKPLIFQQTRLVWFGVLLYYIVEVNVSQTLVMAVCAVK